MLVVGLIGPMGAGKSVVAQELASCGAEVIRADEISRDALAPGTDELAEVVRVFGRDCLSDEGTLDRRALGGVVFADAQARERLESIVHPAMVRRMRERLAELKHRRPPVRLVVIEAANLVQMDGLDLVDLTVMVTAPRDERLRRVMARDGLSSIEVERRLSAQEEQGIGAFAADRVMVTDGTPEATREQTQRLYEELVEGRRGPRVEL